MPHAQLLAYCRLIQLWTPLYLIKILNFSPLFSLIVTSGLHIVTLNLNSKRIGILSLDIIQILSILYISNNLYIIENSIVFLIYINLLLLYEKDPISLYLVELRHDDEIYKDETFIEYINRIFLYAIAI
jgi:hypothetical protein